MKQNRALWITIGFLVLSSLACNAFSGNLEPLPPPPTEAAIIQPSATPSFAPTATQLINESPGEALVKVLVDLNVRSGPGVHYDRIGFLLEGDSAAITGVHPQSGWWQIACPEEIIDAQCWVSGGNQYTHAEDAAGIPEVNAPPTPVPILPESSIDSGFLVYIDNGRLYLQKLAMDQSPLGLAGDPILLTEQQNVQEMAISPDGLLVAFIAGGFKENSLYIVNTEGQDQRLLMDSTALPPPDDQDSTDRVLLLSQMAWLLDSSAVAFNTSQLFLTGPGVISQEDFWLADLEGDVKEVYPPGAAGGSFLLNSNNTVYLSSATAVNRADTAGGGSAQILQFPFINTASEYVYYPLPQLASGGYDFVAVPDAEPWEPGGATNLWRLPETGEAELLGSLEDVSMLNPVAWSPNGQQTAYIQQAVDQVDPLIARLFIAAQDGSDPLPYAGGERLAFHSWAAGSDKFLYSGTGFIAVGSKNAPPQQFILPTDQVINDARWLTESTFIISVGSLETGAWQLSMVDLAGEMEEVVTTQGSNPAFDTWLP